MLHGIARSKLTLHRALCCTFLLLAARSAGAETQTSGIQLSVGGTISSHLPRPRDDQRLIADYPALGSIRITTTQYCGDGDVARFSASNPTVDFVSAGSVSFVMGYWIVPSGQQHPIPTENNWYPLGTGATLASNGSREDLAAIGKKGASRQMIQLVNESLNSMAATSGYRMKAAGAPDTYSLYYGILMCKSILKPSSSSQAFPQPFNVAKTFQSSVLASIEGEVQAAGSIKALEKFKLDSDDSGVTIDVKGGSLSIANDYFYQLATTIMALAFPKDATDVPSYQKAFPDPVWNNLSALHTQLYGKATCYRSDITGVENQGLYPWEAIPLNLTCMALSSYNGNSLDTLIKAFLMPAVLPNEAGFKAAQLELAKALTKAALMQQSQQIFASTYKRPNDSCFADNQLHINKVMGSLPINIVPGKSSSSATMVHPEGSLAIGEINKYRGVDGNYNSIFMMSTEAFQPITLTQGQVANPDSVLTKSYLLRFNVRGIGCNGVVFCKNEGGSIVQ